jgi:hypothetical protein
MSRATNLGLTVCGSTPDNGLLATVTTCSQWSGTSCTGSSYVDESNFYDQGDNLEAQTTDNGRTETPPAYGPGPERIERGQTALITQRSQAQILPPAAG